MVLQDGKTFVLPDTLVEKKTFEVDSGVIRLE